MNATLFDLELRVALLQENLRLALGFGGKVPYTEMTVARVKAEIRNAKAQIKALRKKAA